MRNTSFYRLSAGLLAIVASAGFAPAAFAQDTGTQKAATTAESDQDANDGALTEIVVTAQKSEGNVQRVPISIQTYSGEELSNRGVATVRALTTIDPSVGISTSAGQNIVTVRGITSSNATEVGEPAVGFGLDGIFNNRGYSVGATLYDVARIEILRGPQGTLFGRNTTGGLINVITERPTDVFSGRTTLDLGSYRTINVDGFVNLPVADGLNVRASFAVRRHDGYRRNSLAFIDARYDDEDVQSGRFQIAYEPTQNIDLWVSASFTHEGGTGSAAQESIPFRYDASVPTSQYYRTGAGAPEWLHTLPPNISDGRTFAYYGANFQDTNTVDVKGSLTWRIGGGLTLSYLGGYNHIDFIRGATSLRAPLNLPWTFTRREFPTTMNHEIRLASSQDGPLIWQVGAFYSSERSHLYTSMVQNQGSSSQTLVYVFDTPRIFANSKAVFAQATYSIADVVRITGGVRYTDDKKERRGIQRLGVAMTNGASQNGSAASDKVTWLGGIDINLTPRNMLYAKVSNGYKAGGFTSNGTYRPETVTSYEVGSKNRFFDNRLQVNVSGYVMKFNDQQVNQYVIIPGTATSAATTVNAGQSTIKGFEINVTANTSVGRFNVAANYLDARYDNFLQSAAWNSTINLNLAGNRLPNAPRWAVSAGYEYTVRDVAGGSLTGRVDGLYKSGLFFAPTNYPDQYQPAATTIDASLTYTTGNDRVSVQLYVTNLTNKTKFSYADETTVYFDHIFSYAPPRTYGIRLTGRF